MRLPTVLSVALVLCLAAPLPAASGGGPAAREWTVSGLEDLSDRTVFLEENLTIAAGGRLVLDNVTLRFNSSEGSPLVLEVLAGGELVLRNCSLDWNGSGPYLVRALPGSKLTVSGCTVSHAGTCATLPALSGFLVATALCAIDNTTFRQAAAGLYLLDCSPPVTGCRFLAASPGAVLDGSAAQFRWCRFDSGLGRDLLLLNGSRASAIDSDIDPALVEPADGGCSLDILWSLTVSVGWDTGRPAAGAVVRVKPSDGPATLHQANSSGVVGGIGVLSSTVSASGLSDHGPFNISAESEGRSAWNITEVKNMEEVQLILDGTPPEITIDYPPQGASINGTPLPASGTAWDPYQIEDRPGISLVEAQFDDGPWESVNGTDRWSTGLAGLSESVHTLTVRAWDLAGNSNLSAVRFVVDLTPPKLEVVLPSGNLSSAPNVTVRITTNGVAVSFNGTPVPGHLPDRPLDVVWALELEGDNIAVVESWDVAGNTARRELLVVRDTTPPEVVFTSPPAFSVVNTSLVTVAGESSDLHGIVLVEWGVDRENWTRANGTERWSFLARLYEGQNTVYVRATDGAGNAATGWLRLDLQLPDTTPPELRILYPEDGQAVSSSAIEVTVRATDAGGVRSVQLSVDGSSWANATGALDWTGRLTLSSGNNTVWARAFDLAGNVNSTSVSVSYSPPPPDTSPPALLLLYPPPRLKVTQGKLVVSGRAADPSGVSSVELSTDGKRWSPCIISGEDWSGTVTLAPGTNTIRVRATDRLGNRAVASTTAVYERPADPAAGRSTIALVSVLAMLALMATWLLARAPPPRRRQASRPLSEEE